VIPSDILLLLPKIALRVQISLPRNWLQPVNGYQRYQPRRNEFRQRLVERMLELVREHPRYGYRRIWALLRREGWRVNRKRVHRLWRAEGLKVPQKQRKRRHLGHSANSCARRRAEHQDHVWAWLVELFAMRGVPKHIRSDNGPEFIANAVRRWLTYASVETLYIEPGSPWENGYAESFHSRLRDELLGREGFASLAEARALGTAWHLEYSHRRPHSSLGYRTPAEFAAGCAASGFATLSPQQHSRTPGFNPLPVTQTVLS